MLTKHKVNKYEKIFCICYTNSQVLFYSEAQYIIHWFLKLEKYCKTWPAHN